jgi:hypothetical protein
MASDGSSLRVWFRDEIKNALLSAYATSCAMLPDTERTAESLAFHRGFVSALLVVGLNFGIGDLPFGPSRDVEKVRDAA